jgi:two-component system sensor histidine kinase/response regulator
MDTELRDSESAVVGSAIDMVGPMSHAELWPSPSDHPRRLGPVLTEEPQYGPEWRSSERELAVEELRQRIASLEARNRELSAFAHTVAHDLKSPLFLMAGYAEVVVDQSSTLSAAEIADCLGTIQRQAHKMSAIVDELLLLAGVDQQRVEAVPLDMGSIVAKATQRLAHMVKEYQAEIALPQVWPLSWGYGPWVEEVWANYLSNAIKYGGRPPQVQVSATRENGMVRFTVRDNGRGLAPGEQSCLFTPFVRLHQVRVDGHGLGLSIVRRIVEKLGGRVGIESELGQGSLFSFTLPAWPATSLEG